MYCPRCSQSSADNLRFCPRCGLPLDLVAELVTNDGALAPPREKSAPAGKLSFQRKGVRRGAKIIFFSLFLLQLAFGFSLFVDSPGPLLLPLLIFLIGSARLLFAIIFGESEISEKAETRPATFSPATPRFDLPAPQFNPIINFNAGHSDTAEMVAPPSVTEHTTKLLD